MDASLWGVIVGCALMALWLFAVRVRARVRAASANRIERRQRAMLDAELARRVFVERRRVVEA